MARKQRSFAAKIAKGTGPQGEKCPVCGEVKQVIQVVRPYRTEIGSWRYNVDVKRVCKCNRAEALSDTV